MASINTVQASDLYNMDACNCVLVDVRTPPEYAGLRYAGKHIFSPLDTLDPEELLFRHALDKDCCFYFLCQSGNRAKKAAERLLAAGFPHLFVVEGGLSACRRDWLPLAGPKLADMDKQSFSIERQVRIGAGSLVCLGILLGLIIHPAFVYLSLFVGAGLVFAGITNWCGMALLLMRAPWNQTQPGCSGGACAIGQGGAGTGKSCQ